MSSTEHHAQAAGFHAACAVLTISDTRTEADDASGRIIRESLQAAGHSVEAMRIVKDEPAQIEAQLRTWVDEERINAICCTGGTGISRRDSTIEVAQRVIDKPLDGFGELFRMLSWEQVGSAAMMSRAMAGMADQTVVFVMPGSSKAVKLAMDKLIVPELSHLVWEQKK